ncbi:hypothetical protein MAPG_00919 [Magnaporthiopsis poae ATCC 64411]|uniref:Uncharacterized protein n=1 Tax=Magnaporthiopsis poae (strain ATCC 64411 / 73-15) TaxID=644358 RepID=A0A0C4DMB5_MAGP6|nr:hypothetical protein MAPG_00919 [Magnaporthiopsis poae ATCC 64411]
MQAIIVSTGARITSIMALRPPRSQYYVSNENVSSAHRKAKAKGSHKQLCTYHVLWLSGQPDDIPSTDFQSYDHTENSLSSPGRQHLRQRGSAARLLCQVRVAFDGVTESESRRERGRQLLRVGFPTHLYGHTLIEALVPTIPLSILANAGTY